MLQIQQEAFLSVIWMKERVMIQSVREEKKGNLAGGEHVGDSFSAEVGRMDDVLLPGRVPCSHCLSSCNGDALSHADELLGRGCLVGSILGLKDLKATKCCGGGGSFDRRLIK